MSEVLYLSDHQRLLTTLRTHVRRHPRSLQAIERRLGWSRSYLSRKLGGAISLSTEQLLEILKIVDLNLSELEAKASWVDVEGLLEGLLPEGSRNPAPIVELRRVARELAERDGVIGENIEVVEPHLSTLLAVDRLRFSHPWPAARQAFAVAAHVAPAINGDEAKEIFSRAAGVYASCCRMGGSPEDGVRAILVALSAAGSSNPQLRASLMERAAYLLISFAQNLNAIAVFDLADSINIGTGDRSCRGRLAVGRGVAWHLENEFQLSATEFLSALQLLSNCEQVFAGSAHQCLGQVRMDEGDLIGAAREIEFARTLLADGDVYSLGIVEWTAARLASKCGQSEQAELLFRGAVDNLMKINPFDTTLVCLDWVKLLLEKGEAADAVLTARRTARLIEQFESNPIAGRTILELKKASLRGQLTFRLVGAARMSIESGRCLGIRPLF